MSTFKAGDRVKCIEGKTTAGLVTGAEFEVAAMYESSGYEYLTLKTMAGHLWSGWMPSRFELVKPAIHKLSGTTATAIIVDEMTPKPTASLSPQCKKLLSLLQHKGSTTGLEAAGIYRIRSLSRRICDLKKAGHKITSAIRTDDTGQRYARYYLVAA